MRCQVACLHLSWQRYDWPVCACVFEKYHNEKKLMVLLQVRGPQVQPVFHNNSKEEGTNGGGNWWQIPMRWWFALRFARKASWLHRTAGGANRNWFHLALTRHLLPSFTKLGCEFALPRLTKLSASSCSCHIEHWNVTCKSYSNTFLWTKARTVPSSKTPARLCSPAVVCTSFARFQHVYWQQRTAEDIKAGPRRIMFNRRSSRNKLFIIKSLIIGM